MNATTRVFVRGRVPVLVETINCCETFSSLLTDRFITLIGWGVYHAVLRITGVDFNVEVVETFLERFIFSTFQGHSNHPIGVINIHIRIALIEVALNNPFTGTGHNSILHAKFKLAVRSVQQDKVSLNICWRIVTSVGFSKTYNVILAILKQTMDIVVDSD